VVLRTFVLDNYRYETTLSWLSRVLYALYTKRIKFEMIFIRMIYIRFYTYMYDLASNTMFKVINVLKHLSA